MVRIVLLALFLLSPACTKAHEKTKEPTPDRTSASRPAVELGEVVATVQLPSGTNTPGLAKLIDNVRPGASALMAAQMPIMLGMMVQVDLSAADLSGPVAIVVLNPSTHPDPIALLVKSAKDSALVKSAKDAGKLGKAKNGFVLLGSPDAVAAAEAFAFGNLTKPSEELVSIIYPGPLVAAYQGKFDEMVNLMKQVTAGNPGQGPMLGVIMDMYKQLLVALGQQSDRIEITVGTDGKSSEMYLRLYPKAGTTMEALANAQMPTDQKLLSRLPASSTSNMIFVGDMRAGAARDAILDFSVSFMAAMYSAEMAPSIESATRAWMEVFDGSVAATMDMDLSTGKPSMAMRYLMGTTDSVKTQKVWREFMSSFAESAKQTPNILGMKVDVEFREKVRSFDAVEIDAYKSTFDTTGMDPAMTQSIRDMESTLFIASFDKLAAMSMATGTTKPEALDEMISAARGKTSGFEAHGVLADALAQSKARKESLLMTFDIGAIAKGAPQPMPFSLLSMGLGKDQSGALVLRMGITP